MWVHSPSASTAWSPRRPSSLALMLTLLAAPRAWAMSSRTRPMLADRARLVLCAPRFSRRLSLASSCGSVFSRVDTEWPASSIIRPRSWLCRPPYWPCHCCTVSCMACTRACTRLTVSWASAVTALACVIFSRVSPVAVSGQTQQGAGEGHPGLTSHLAGAPHHPPTPGPAP